MTQGTLYSYSLSDLTLTEAIQKYSEYLEEAIALLYSPQSCEFAKLETSGKLTNFEGKDINLDYQVSYIFEARIFNVNCELRWLNQSNGKGYAVLILEPKISNLPDAKEESKLYLDDIPNQQYLLWGEKINTQLLEGWVKLSSARIGSLNIPLNEKLEKKQRVYLKTVEYLAEIDDFGNVSVIEERLVKLEVK